MEQAVRRQLCGTVIRVTEKTAKVLVEWSMRHPKFGKVMRRKTHYLVHDPEQVAQVGQNVYFQACRPISKRKHWVVTSVAATDAQAKS